MRYSSFGRLVVKAVFLFCVAMFAGNLGHTTDKQTAQHRNHFTKTCQDGYEKLSKIFTPSQSDIRVKNRAKEGCVALLETQTDQDWKNPDSDIQGCVDSIMLFLNDNPKLGDAEKRSNQAFYYDKGCR